MRHRHRHSGRGTGWPRSWPVRAVRRAVQTGLLAPTIFAELAVERYGHDLLDGDVAVVGPPALIVANHASHLDAAVLLSTLPTAWRRRTAVATPADSFADRWRRLGTALAFNTFPTVRGEGVQPAAVADRLLQTGWNVLVFPEETRSPDGFLRAFHPSVAALAIAEGVPVVPVGLRGTYAAMPRGRAWPVPGRPRVSVRYGVPLTPGPAESAADLTGRLQAAVADLVAEDATSWWAVQRDTRAAGSGPESTPAPQTHEIVPPPAGWRRIWEQSEVPAAGGQPRRPKIWRQ